MWLPHVFRCLVLFVGARCVVSRIVVYCSQAEIISVSVRVAIETVRAASKCVRIWRNKVFVCLRPVVGNGQEDGRGYCGTSLFMQMLIGFQGNLHANLSAEATRACARLFSERSQDHGGKHGPLLVTGPEGPSMQVWVPVVLMICSLYMHLMK